MSAALQPTAAEQQLLRRARSLIWAASGWNLTEFAVAVAAGVAASSPALLGFGLDSLIESATGFVILWRLGHRGSRGEIAERHAQRLIAAGYGLLACYIAAESLATLIDGQHPSTSWVGVALAAVATVAMPLVAANKRRLGRALGSAAAVTEAGQNMICAYLSVALLVGLLTNALIGWWWADPAAALLIAAIAVREGLEAWRERDHPRCC